MFITLFEKPFLKNQVTNEERSPPWNTMMETYFHAIEIHDPFRQGSHSCFAWLVLVSSSEHFGYDTPMCPRLLASECLGVRLEDPASKSMVKGFCNVDALRASGGHVTCCLQRPSFKNSEK